jgi:hypothetical protein
MNDPLITLLAIPKPYVGHIGRIQRAALASWVRLRPRADVVLVGDAEGTAEAAARWGAAHHAELATNAMGTPLVNGALRVARDRSVAPYLGFLNADIVLGADFLKAVERLAQAKLDPFLAIGRRINLDTEALGLDPEGISERDWPQLAAAHGRLAAIVCKDFFVFPRCALTEVPAFAVGRGNWDNWMVHSAKQRGWPVIDMTPSVRAIHLDHNHRHVAGGSGAAYVTGDEARENQRLAGGRHLIAGSTATWVLTRDALVRRRWPNGAFWKDLPRLASLVHSLKLWRRAPRSKSVTPSTSGTDAPLAGESKSFGMPS